MYHRIARLAGLLPLLAGIAIWPQEPTGNKQALQQRITELKQSMGASQAKLKKYGWTETIQVSLKGEVKKRIQHDCHYGADGKVVKTAIGAETEAKKKRGLRGKVVEKKVDEMKDYMDRAESLVHRYVPPSSENMQALFQAGKASLTMSGGTTALVFNDYAKPGDKVIFNFDPAAKRLQNFSVNTYLDDPSDAVTLTTEFATLPDSTNYLAHSVLDGKSKQIQINTTNTGHHPITQ